MFEERKSLLHQQETDFNIIKILLPFIENMTFLDIGAEKGTFSRFLIDHQFKGVLFEPFHGHQEDLKSIAKTHDCLFFPYAIHDQDGLADFFIASDQENNILPYFHSLNQLTNDHRIQHNTTVTVTCRSLNSLLKEGTIEKNIGIVKIDTEGNDLKVLQGMNEICPEVLIVEFFMPGIYSGWDQGDAYCLIEQAKQYGFNHFIAIKRMDYLELISIDLPQFLDKQWGNIIFIRDTLFEKIKPNLHTLSMINEKNLIEFHKNTTELREEINLLRRICDERLQLINSLDITLKKTTQELNEQPDIINNTKQALTNFFSSELYHPNKFSQIKKLFGFNKKTNTLETVLENNPLRGIILNLRKDFEKNIHSFQKEINLIHNIANERLQLIIRLHNALNNNKNIKITNQLLRQLKIFLIKFEKFQNNFNTKSTQIPSHLTQYKKTIDDMYEFNEQFLLQMKSLYKKTEIKHQHEIIHTYQHRTLREHFEKIRALLKSAIAPKLGTLMHYPPRPLTTPTRYHKKSSFKNLPSISIVTPTYKQGNFLERTIESVIGQDYPFLEYIIQDGGSEDRTIEILERYKSYLKYWASSQDEGQSHAINLGFSQSTGEIMAYLNSDDLLLPGALHYIGEFFAKNPDIDVIYGHRILIDEDNKEIGRWVLPYHDSNILSWADYIPQETLFWRRRIWDKVGGKIDESFRFAMDWDLIVRFRDAGGKFVRLPRFLGAFRIHPDQKTSTHISNMGMEEMNRIRTRCHGRITPFKEVNHRIRSYLYRHVIYHRLYRAGILRY